MFVHVDVFDIDVEVAVNADTNSATTTKDSALEVKRLTRCKTLAVADPTLALFLLSVLRKPLLLFKSQGVTPPLYESAQTECG